MQSVIRAFKFYDLVTAGGGARKSDGVHGGFGTAVAEAAHFDWKTGADFFSKLPLHVMRHAEHGAGGKAFFDGLHHGRMTVSSHKRAEGEVVVDIFVAIEVAELAAAGFFHEDGPRIVVAIVAGHTERNAFEILLVRLGGFGSAALEGCEFFLQFGIHQVAPGKTQAGCGH